MTKAEHTLQMRVSLAFLEKVDRWRGRQPGVPNRSAAIRWIVEKYLSEAEAVSREAEKGVRQTDTLGSDKKATPTTEETPQLTEES